MIRITSWGEPCKGGCAQIAYRGFIISLSTVSLSCGISVYEGEIGTSREPNADKTEEIFQYAGDALPTLEDIVYAKAWIDRELKSREALAAHEAERAAWEAKREAG